MIEKLNYSFKRELLSFISYTFGIAWTAWGIEILLIALGIIDKNSSIYWFLFIIGGNSPAISELIREKKYRNREEFNEFIKNCVAPVKSIWSYLFVTCYAGIFGIVLYWVQHGENALQIYMFIPLTIIMLIGGGTEEIGWRGLLQPLLEKKFSMFISSVLVSLIWGIWHLPLWFIAGTSQSQMNFGAFLIMTLGLSITLAVVRALYKSIFMCILFHCMINASLNVAAVSFEIKSNMIILVISIIIYLVYVWKKASRIKEQI